MFSIMFISRDCAGHEILEIHVQLSIDEFSKKNGAQERCHPERTKACHQCDHAPFRDNLSSVCWDLL